MAMEKATGIFMRGVGGGGDDLMQVVVRMERECIRNVGGGPAEREGSR